MRESARSFGRTILAGALAIAGLMAGASASEFSEPWLRSDRALVIDAYEYNEIDWQKLATDKRIAGFIGKGSDGLPPAYRCSGDEAEKALCSALWKRYSVAKELFHTRKAMAKSLGLEWGAYHLGRPGNPIEQANHFIDFAQPGPDDLVAIDVEENDPEKWMSLEDAEEFARHIKRRIGRFPVLYTNGSTAQYIADNRARYPLLSRLPLWYARYKPEIGEHFPKGNWQNYALWQFVSQTNCNARKCPYRVPGTNNDIDVNVASMSADELRKAWPFDALIDVPEELIASIPVPTPRHLALGGNVTLTYASVTVPKSVAALAKVFAGAGADQNKLALEPGAGVQAASATPTEDPLKPARGKIKLVSAAAKPAATYVRLSALNVPTIPLRVRTTPLVENPVAATKQLSSSDHHIGTAEYIAWRKDNGLAIGPTADASDKRSRLVAEGAGDHKESVLYAVDDSAVQTNEALSDPATTGSVAIAVGSHSADAGDLAASAQKHPRSNGWFDRFKAYLGLF